MSDVRMCVRFFFSCLFLCVRLPVRMYACFFSPSLSVCPYVCLFLLSGFSLSVRMSVCFYCPSRSSVYMSVCLPVSIVCLVSLSVCPYVCLFPFSFSFHCLYVCLSILTPVSFLCLFSLSVCLSLSFLCLFSPTVCICIFLSLNVSQYLSVFLVLCLHAAS